MSGTVRTTPDPLYRDLPSGDGTPRYLVIEGYSAEITELTLRTLLRSAWHRHRVGRAVYAHCVNGSRWIIGLSMGGEVPAWWDRLEARRGR
ncbi:MAG: hypothetical protein ACYDCI_11960 [Candidatus Limnocylindrales bacterium]